MLGLYTPLGEMKNPLAFYALDFGRELISSYGNDDIQQKYISRQANGELIFRDHFKKDDAMWPHIEEPLEEIRALCSQEMAKNELLIKSNLLRIWHYLCLDAEATSFTLKKKDDERVRMIKQILQYIQENYARNLTLCGLAAYFHMSEGQFCRIFKQTMKMSPMQYLMRYRILQSCRLLQDTDKKIGEIANLSGFNNISYFNKVFLQTIGCTPREYRSTGNY